MPDITDKFDAELLRIWPVLAEDTPLAIVVQTTYDFRRQQPEEGRKAIQPVTDYLKGTRSKVRHELERLGAIGGWLYKTDIEYLANQTYVKSIQIETELDLVADRARFGE